MPAKRGRKPRVAPAVEPVVEPAEPEPSANATVNFTLEDVANLITDRMNAIMPNLATQSHPKQRLYVQDLYSVEPPVYTGEKGAAELLMWFENMEEALYHTETTEDKMVEHATSQFDGAARSWWTGIVTTVGRKTAYAHSWEELQKMMRAEFCTKDTLQELEQEFWDLKMEGLEIEKYILRFNELARLVPHLASTEEKKIYRFIWGLIPEIRRDLTSKGPKTMSRATVLAKTLTKDIIRSGGLSENVEKGKRKAKEVVEKKVEPPSKKGKILMNYAVTAVPEPTRYSGAYPRCSHCNLHHTGACPVCYKCQGVGHMAKYWNAVSANLIRTNPPPVNKIPQMRNARPPLPPTNHQQQQKQNQQGPANARVFALNAEEARQNPRVVIGTFLLNEHYASVLFDSGAERSFVALDFKSKTDMKTGKLNDKYVVEYANGHKNGTNEIALDCPLILVDKNFTIDLIPVEISSFDEIVGMDWLSKHHATICCHEKSVHIPLQNSEILIVQGDKSTNELKIVSAMKFRKYLDKKDHLVYLAHVIDKSAKELKVQDIPIVRDFPDVFPDNLPGIPLVRQVEFNIDLVPGAVPVAKAPYRLAPPEMQELSINCKNF
uniref:uncharacterized protein LOC122591560 n=1 Tax=Erigeron canadensis TaxID=72917 RepID=UPI001CB8D4D4|nr:uncharacterized protein LOC122591560 [Erigeron canadensis]